MDRPANRAGSHPHLFDAAVGRRKGKGRSRQGVPVGLRADEEPQTAGSPSGRRSTTSTGLAGRDSAHVRISLWSVVGRASASPRVSMEAGPRRALKGGGVGFTFPAWMHSYRAEWPLPRRRSNPSRRGPVSAWHMDRSGGSLAAGSPDRCRHVRKLSLTRFPARTRRLGRVGTPDAARGRRSGSVSGRTYLESKCFDITRGDPDRFPV